MKEKTVFLAHPNSQIHNFSLSVHTSKLNDLNSNKVKYISAHNLSKSFLKTKIIIKNYIQAMVLVYQYREKRQEKSIVLIFVTHFGD